MAFGESSEAVEESGGELRPARILIVLSGLTAGGSERVISLLVNHWAARQRQVTLVSFDATDSSPFFELDARVQVQQLGLPFGSSGKLRRLWQVLRRVLALRSIIRKTAPDVILSFLTKINIVTLLAARGMETPVIISERNNPLMQPMDPVWSWLRRRLYPAAHRLIAQTEDVAKHLPPQMRSKAIVIPNPIMPAIVGNGASRKKVVAGVGRLVEQKGFDLFLRAIAKIGSKCEDWSFVIWGEGDQRGELEALARELGIAHRVKMPGVSEGPHAWLSEAAIFVLSSRYEGFPNALGEAMAVGLPVVAFDCPFGPRALVQNDSDGILVQSEDVDALAEAIAKLVQSEDLRNRLGEAARKGMMRFAPERVLGQWDEVAEAAIQSRAGPGRPARAQGPNYQPDRM